MRFLMIPLAGLLAVSGTAQAIDCAASQALPIRPTLLAPIASELVPPNTALGAQSGVLSQAYDEAQSVDQVLLRLRIAGCRDVAKAMPAPSAIDPNDPAAYKPKTQFDNTPWRFDMSQNGKRMTADEFSAWMKARGVRVARGAGAGAAAATTPAVVAPGATSAPANLPPGTLPAPAPAAAPPGMLPPATPPPPAGDKPKTP